VYELRLIPPSCLSPSTLKSLATTPAARANTLRSLYLSARTQIVLFQLMDTFPALTRIAADTDIFEDYRTPANFPHCASLQEMNIVAKQVWPEAQDKFRYFVASHCDPPLEILSTEVPSNAYLELGSPLVQRLTFSLRSVSSNRWDDATAYALASLPLLEELQLWTGTTIKTTRTLLETLPSSLVHLAFPSCVSFTGDRDDSEQGMIDDNKFLSTRLRRLRVLTCYDVFEALPSSASNPHACSKTQVRSRSGFSVHLATVLSQRGVEVRMGEGVDALRRVSLVPKTIHFPRKAGAERFAWMDGHVHNEMEDAGSLLEKKKGGALGRLAKLMKKKAH